ncbi:MAG: Holliday junction resolvase RuvX [Clostridia bacterium]|nr:Holliday junction resolvase RuvX [Clostridia bacterium]
MKILAVDYGLARTGVAVSDATGTIATPLDCIPSRNEDRMLGTLLGVIERIKPEKIIVGLPLRTDMRRSEMADKVTAFFERLRTETGADIELCNEMYTTVIASQLLHQNEKKSKEQRRLIDSAAAAVLLQGYLDKLKQTT